MYICNDIKTNAHICGCHVAINNEAIKNLTSDPNELDLRSNFLEVFPSIYNDLSYIMKLKNYQITISKYRNSATSTQFKIIIIGKVAHVNFFHLKSRRAICLKFLDNVAHKLIRKNE